jgi:hypothetical protein
VVDAKGRKYDIPVLVGGLAANREVYRIGIGCPFEEIDARWVKAAQNPIPPRIVDNAPCHEIVISGKALDKAGQGLDGIPFPISTPGWDIAPYATLSQYITKDPDTGIQNMGNYRGQVKTRRRLGMNPSLELFTLYAEKVLAPTLAKGDIVVLDNLGSHKGKAARNAIRATGAHLIFLGAGLRQVEASSASRRASRRRRNLAQGRRIARSLLS